MLKAQKFSRIITTLALTLLFSSGSKCFAGDILIEDDPRILRAYELICEKRLVIAKGYVSNLLKKYKNNIHLLNMRGFICVYLDEYKQTLADSSKVLKADPDNLSALARRGFSLLNLGKYKEGINDLNKLLSQVPDDYPNLLNRSKAHNRLGQKKEALRDYNLALKYILITDVSLIANKEGLLKRIEQINDKLDTDSKDPYLFLARAKSFYKLKKFKNAIEDTKSAIAANPAVGSRARYIRAKVYLREGKSDKAIQDLNYIIKERPKIVDWGYFAMCPNDLKAKKWRRKIVRLPDVYVDRARAYSKKGSYDMAVKDCTTSLSLNKNNLNALLVRASAYDAQNKFQKAAIDYKSAVDLSNGRKDTVYMLSRSLQKLNKISSGRTKLLTSLTSSLQDLGQHREALNTLTKLQKTNPNDKTIYKAKIRSLLALGRNWSAVTECDKLISLDKNDSESYLMRADAKIKLKEYNEAIEDCNLALTKGAGVKARKKRAHIYKKQGKTNLYQKELARIRNSKKSR